MHVKERGMSASPNTDPRDSIIASRMSSPSPQMSSSEPSSSSEEDSEELEDQSNYNEAVAPRKKRRITLELTDDIPSRVQKAKSNSTLPETSVTTPIPTNIAAARDPSALKSRTSFATLNVSPWLVASLTALSVKRPTAIQAACIPPILSGSDCLGGSKTGSGKTIAFAVPILQKWAQDPSGIFAVVLTPTRELALQIHEQFSALGAAHSLKCLLVTGGADMLTQATGLATRPHVVVATPGRLADHVRTSGAETIVGLKRTRIVVLDEADRLLQPGRGSMLDDVDECLSAMPDKTRRQTCLFTATVTAEVRALKESSQTRTRSEKEMFIAELDISNNTPTTEDTTQSVKRVLPTTLQQTYLLTPTTHRDPYLHVLLSTPANTKKSTIVFTNRTTTARLLEHTLRLLDHRVTSLHSLLPQRDRSANLARFRARAARILVATDVASRGLDIPDVEFIVNYDAPRDPDDYVHRVGRTARAGRRGMSVTMVGQRDVELVHAIEERTGGQMAAFDEEGVSIEGRVVREGLKIVGEKRREALVGIESGLDVKGKRRRR